MNTLRPYLSAVFAEEVVSLCAVLEEDAPASHVRGSQQQVLAVASLDGHVATVAGAGARLQVFPWGRGQQGGGGWGMGGRGQQGERGMEGRRCGQQHGGEEQQRN